MNLPAVPHEILLRLDKLLQRCLDRIEQDIGDETIDSGIGAAGPGATQVAALWHPTGQHLEIGEAARIGGIRREAAEALVVIAPEIELARLQESFFRQAGVLLRETVAKGGPEALILPARIGHDPIEVIEQARRIDLDLC